MIVGAGAAGLAAAVSLADIPGIEVAVAESRGIIGGRAYSFNAPVPGMAVVEEIDNGQHMMIGAYNSFFRLLEKLGTYGFIRPQKRLRVPICLPGGRRTELRSRLPGRAGLALAMASLGGVTASARLKAIKFALDMHLGKIPVAGRSAREVFEAGGQMNELYEVLWEPLVLAFCNSDPGQAPGTILKDTFSKAFFGAGNSATLMFPTVGLSELFRPFRSYLAARGGALFTGERIDSMTISDGRIDALSARSGRKYEADAYILAVPPNSLARILPDETDAGLARAARSFAASTIISGYFAFRDKVMDAEITGLTGVRTHWLFNRDMITGISADGLHRVAATISAAGPLAGLSLDELAGIIVDDIRKCLPGAGNYAPVYYKIIKDKKATVLITPSTEQSRPGARTAIKNLFIAGDWTATKLPATLESAALSGEIAAKEVVNYLRETSAR